MSNFCDTCLSKIQSNAIGRCLTSQPVLIGSALIALITAVVLGTLTSLILGGVIHASPNVIRVCGVGAIVTIVTALALICLGETIRRHKN